MDGLDRHPRSLRKRLCGARVATLLCLAIAALASCQPFREDDAVFAAPLTDFADYDACQARDGRWLPHAHRCKDPSMDDAGPFGPASH